MSDIKGLHERPTDHESVNTQPGKLEKKDLGVTALYGRSEARHVPAL